MHCALSPLLIFFTEVTSMLWYYSYFYIVRFYIHVPVILITMIYQYQYIEMVLNPLWWEMLISRAWNLLIRGLNPSLLSPAAPDIANIYFIWKNTICYFDKYILQCGKILAFAIWTNITKTLETYNFDKILKNCKPAN